MRASKKKISALRRNMPATLLSALVIFAASGCAEINPFEAPGEVMRNPLGKDSIRAGMSKEEVVSKWGEPDFVNKLPETDASGSQAEEWIYKARRYTPVPVDVGYLHENQYLYFDGNNLTVISSQPR